MGLDISDIRRELVDQRKKPTISRAIFHQNRVKFHTMTQVSEKLTQPVNTFLSFVSNLIPEDKFTIFKALFRYPIKTNEITGICFDKLSRIFDGRNPAYTYQFQNSEQRDDWEQYRLQVLHEPEIWNTKGWEFFKTEINSVLIVDMPTKQKGKYPAPYFYFLPIADVISYSVNYSTGIMDWIIFKQEDGTLAVIDDERYRVFTYKDRNIGELLIDNAHDLGYCPAKFFWDEPISLTEPDIKASPITKALEMLDWYLFYFLSKRHLDLYGAYPIYSGYEQSCDYNDSDGNFCSSGFLKDRQGFYKLDAAGKMMPCPKCGHSPLNGVGSFVKVPIPSENQPNLSDPVKMLTVDRDSLEYNVSEEARLRNDIITSVIGTNEEITAREALNEQQIKANFESQSTILNRIKKGFESAEQFVDETICRLRYGSLFITAKINLGTEFYLYSATELRERYRIAKESGASESELDALQNQIIATEYRNDPIQLQRMLILSELEPYRHLTRDEVINLYDKQLISQETLMIKLNFINYIKRFEREFMNILEFGKEKQLAERVEIITNKLIDYASENK